MMGTKGLIDLVRSTGLEPAHLTAYAPQTDVGQNTNLNKSKQLAVTTRI